MKNYICDHCHKQNATYYYRTDINGKVTESHLCSDCAGKLGTEQNFFTEANRMMQDFDEMFDSFLPSFNGFFRTPVFSSLFSPRSFFLPEDSEGKKEACAAAVKDKAGVDPELEKRRQINMLREQMNEAVSKEDFETAAQIRDRIRAMENEKKSA